VVVVVDIVIPSGGGVPTALLRRPRSLPGGVLRSFAAPDVVVDEEGARAVCGRPVCPRQGGAGVDAGDVDVEIRLEEGRKSADPPAPRGVVPARPWARPARGRSTTPPRARNQARTTLSARVVPSVWLTDVFSASATDRDRNEP